MTAVAVPDAGVDYVPDADVFEEIARSLDREVACTGCCVEPRSKRATDIIVSRGCPRDEVAKWRVWVELKCRCSASGVLLLGDRCLHDLLNTMRRQIRLECADCGTRVHRWWRRPSSVLRIERL